MKRAIKAAAAGMLVLIALAMVGVAWLGFSEPPVHRLPLAPDLIDASSLAWRL